MRFLYAALLLPFASGFLGACASLMDMDGEYELAVTAGAPGSGGGGGSIGGSAAGGTSAGGSASGGTPTAGGGGSGGIGAGGLTGGSGSVSIPDGEAPCSAGEKRCTIDGNDLCVAPDPSVGCGLTGCEQCSAPTGGFGICAGEQCDFDCFDGFVRNGSTCEPAAPPDGGSGGSVGAGGAPGTCTQDSDCPRCGPTLGCCALGSPPRKCGCNFVWCVAF